MTIHLMTFHAPGSSSVGCAVDCRRASHGRAGHHTVLLRQALTTLYAANNPQRSQPHRNPDQLCITDIWRRVVFGGGRWRLSICPVPLLQSCIRGHCLSGMRSSRGGQALGVARWRLTRRPAANQDCGGRPRGKDAGYSQIEPIARNQADGMAHGIASSLRLMVTSGLFAPGGVEWQACDIDPRHWNVDMDVTTQCRPWHTLTRPRFVHAVAIRQTQLMMADRFMAAGATEDAIDMLPKILRTMVKMAESAQHPGNPEDFYPEYTEESGWHSPSNAAEGAARRPGGRC